MGIISKSECNYQEIDVVKDSGEKIIICKYLKTTDDYYYRDGMYKNNRDLEQARLRGRSELLVIRNGEELFLTTKKGEVASSKYAVPGGAWDAQKDTHKYEAAIRETEEEAAIKVHKRSVEIYSEYVKPIQKDSNETRWDGYYTRVYVGEYKGRFRGHVMLRDKDFVMKKTGKFYKIEEVFEELHPAHQDAIRGYLKDKVLRLQSLNDKLNITGQKESLS